LVRIKIFALKKFSFFQIQKKTNYITEQELKAKDGPPSTKLSVCTAVTCSSLTEEI